MSVDTDNRLSEDATYTYTYDNEGNLTCRTRKDGNETVTYTWDYRNRLTGVSAVDADNAPLYSAAYTYDALNRRIGRTVYDGDSNVTLAENYVYDGDSIVLVLDGSGAVKNRYLQGPETDRTLAQVDGSGNVLWLLSDHEGSVRDMVDNDGSQVKHVAYDSFGGIVSENASSVSLRFGYAGREQDSETGLYYNRARYYDPSTGRFISQDPIGFDAGDANLYRYVGNDPMNNTDPTGEEEQSTLSPKLINNLPRGWEVGSTVGPRSCIDCHNPFTSRTNIPLWNVRNGSMQPETALTSPLSVSYEELKRDPVGAIFALASDVAGDVGNLFVSVLKREWESLDNPMRFVERTHLALTPARTAVEFGKFIYDRTYSAFDGAGDVYTRTLAP